MPAERIAVYYRMSRDGQEGSIERQRSQVDPHVAEKGYEVVMVEKDEGISGSEVARRPGLQRILAAARAKEIDGVVMDDLKRLVRLDAWDAVEVFNPLRKAGVWVESVARGRMTYDKVGRLLLTLESEGGNEQLRDTARNVLAKQLEQARDQGRPPLPKPPYGYRREPIPGKLRRKKDGRMVPLFRWLEHEVAADVVRSVFRWYAEGQTVGWIAAELDRRGVQPPASRHRDAGGRLHWRRATVRGILGNSIYVGERAWGKTASGKFQRLGAGGKLVPGDGTRRTVRRPAAEWFVSTDDEIPALVERDVWASCQLRRARGGESSTPGVRDPERPGEPAPRPGDFLLSRLLVCGRCGGWMTGARRPKGCRPGTFYVCSNYVAHATAACVRCPVDEDKVTRQVIAELRRGLLDPERLDWLQGQLEARTREQRSDKNLGRLKADAARLEGRLSKARARLVEVSRDMVPEVEDDIRETRAALEAARKALAEAEAANPVADLKVTVDVARKALWAIESAMEGDNRPLLREALRGLLSKVVIDPEPYQTTTGKTRHRPAERPHVWLRPGSGLDLLANLDGFRSGRSRSTS
jgi:DNA invertase Pin-like site-specific DNA recombinase